MNRTKNETVTRLCAHCGEPFRFRLIPCRANRAFCSRLCAGKGAATRNKTRRLPPGDHIPRLYLLAGWSMPQIAKQYGVTVSAVYILLKRRNVPRRWRTLPKCCCECSRDRKPGGGSRCLFHWRLRKAAQARRRYKQERR